MYVLSLNKGRSALLTLLRALVVRKVDCYSTVLAGVSLSLTDLLQSVLNAAARLVFSARRLEHVTPLLRDLHWLNIECPGKNQVLSLCSDTPLSTWHRSAVPHREFETLQRTSDLSSRRHLRSAATPTLVVPRRPVVLHLATERFRWLPHASETLCHPRCGQSSQLWRSGTQAVSRNMVWGIECRSTRTEVPTRWGLGGVSPPHWGTQKNFSMFSFEMVHFDAFWRTF